MVRWERGTPEKMKGSKPQDGEWAFLRALCASVVKTH